MSEWSALLSARAEQGLLRVQRAHAGPQSVFLQGPNGQRWLNFCSNDYLGMAADPQLVEALVDGAQRYGVGSGASHLVCGHHEIHDRLGAALCAWTGRDRALLFASGWQANLAVIDCFCRAGDWILQDRLNHASLLDAARLARVRMHRYPHADLHSAQQWCRDDRPVRMLVSDAVFSMDGDLAPIQELVGLATSQDALLFLDDAHGLGVLGSQGQGWAAQWSQQACPLLVLTFGKALGGQGACVLGSAELIEWMVQMARPYIYTTAMSPAMACAMLTSVHMVRHQEWRRLSLQSHIAQFRTGCHQRGLPVMNSETSIQPLMVGDSAKAMAISQQLADLGIWVSAIRPPTVPRGTARLRVTLSAAHSAEQIAELLEALDRLWPSELRQG